MGVEKSSLISISDKNNSTAVVFIHGLSGDPFNTWRRDEISKTLPELLSVDIEINSIDFYSYGYKTGLKPGQYDFTAVANILYSDIQANIKEKDIIFVVHSMGGLVVQQYIIDRFEGFDIENLKKIKGVIYLSVPFLGSRLAHLLPKKFLNKQINSLRKNSPLLVSLEEKWHKYVFRGGDEKILSELKQNISQIALHGAQDKVVSQYSSSPLHLGAVVYMVDEDHTSICKVDSNSTVYKHIKDFLMTISGLHHSAKNFMVLHVHGYDKQNYEQMADVEFDWTDHFNVKTSPRILPSTEIWTKTLAPQIELATSLWAREWVNKGGRIRIFAKLSLPGGILLGNRFLKTKGAVLEVEQSKQIWTTESYDKDFKIIPKRLPGNSQESKRVIIILSVSNNIEHSVLSYLDENAILYNMVINILPATGTGQTSIENAGQANAYAIRVKEIADSIRMQGTQEIYLFLNCPFSVSVFVGHHLTVMCPIYLFDFANPGYVMSCNI